MRRRGLHYADPHASPPQLRLGKFSRLHETAHQGTDGSLSSASSLGKDTPHLPPATYFPAGTYPSLYSGRGLAEPRALLPVAVVVSRATRSSPGRLARSHRRLGTRRRLGRSDPADRPLRRPSARAAERTGNRRLRSPESDGYLSGWSLPQGSRRHFERAFGRSPALDEVFGTPSLKAFRRMRRDLLTAPDRVATLTRHLLARDRFDLLWLTFSAIHLAGHQFWDLSQLVDGERGSGEARKARRHARGCLRRCRCSDRPHSGSGA